MEFVYALAGVAAYVLTGFLKSGESFDAWKALRTFVVGVLLTALNAVLGLELPVSELEAVLVTGEVALAENLVKTLWRRLFSTI